MGILTDPTAILACDDDLFEEVYVSEWNGSVRVRSITAAEREKLLQTSVEVSGKSRTINTPLMRVEIVWLAVVDEDGKRLFRSKGELAALGQKSASAIDKVADVALRLAGISDDTGDDTDPKSPSSGSTSDSATT
jgi:hypothetical protein